MGKNKMIAKSCPKCEMQVAVASKACKCGHTFFLSRRAADVLPSPPDELRRRTQRVRRNQPQFYDAQHYQKQKRRSPKKRSLSGSIDESYKTNQKEAAGAAGGRRRRALRRAGRPPAAGAAAAAAPPRPALRPAQLARCRLILQEINRKMQAVVWHPPGDC
ncbi:UPF0547 protein C16orf87 homolog [Pectinophora gossypiella]|nr:UPF0547 protein C16orf87 homolog [Pectinophora gossypiella]